MVLIDATLSRGVSERGWASEPLTDPALRARAKAIKALLAEFKAVGLERLQNPRKAWIGSPLERRFESVFRDVLRETKTWKIFLKCKRPLIIKNPRTSYAAFLLSGQSCGYRNSGSLAPGK